MMSCARAGAAGTGETGNEFAMLDCMGNKVTARRPETLAAINGFSTHFLECTTGCGVVFKALRDEPDSVMANAHAASLMLLSQSADAPAQAQPYLDAGALGAGAATERERLYLDLMARWAARDIDGQSQRFDELSRRFPRDVVAVALGVIHYNSLGDAERMMQLCDNAIAASADIGYMHGVRAFALDQNGRLDEAEAEAQTAVDMNRMDPSAHHAMAHVMLTGGRAAEGAAWMVSLSDTWDACHSHMYTHNWWHTALFYLELGDSPRALEIFDQHVWARDKGYAQDQVNAIALLARLELLGISVAERWAGVAEFVAPRIDEHVQPLLDLHYLYALARAERVEADKMMAGLRAKATEAVGDQKAVWADAMIPVAEGLLAHARSEWPMAAERLRAATPRLNLVGGSNVQRGLFVALRDDAQRRAEG